MNLFNGIEDGKEHTQAFLVAMKELCDFNHVGFIYGGQTAVFEKQNTYYHVTDNGGELNVCTVNKNDTVGVPFTSSRGALNAGTMADRVFKTAMDSYNFIDWDYIMGSVEGLEVDVDMFAPMLEEIDLDYLTKGDGRF